MNEEFATISNRNKSSIGVILVLFILLVIVVQTFCIPSGRRGPAGLTDNETVSAVSTISFYVVNNSTYRLILDSLRGDTSLPSPRDIPPGIGASSRYELTTYTPFGSSATAEYYATDSEGERVGEFSFRMLNLALGLGSEIRNIEVTGALVAAATGKTLYVNNSVLV
ncbi:hypothetical protein [Paenibacillus herberti]|uniref:Uncharacterized protein n=1 Tax=Paenibacillus herberti TaxID=1619309 RepID=A0A229P4E6_9BACL|nr:hypothetical protein [Paenibacillus herberti]OXM17122.1 hypothetical protein CGZ75_11005 [Paenibacillus herberti]